MKKDQPTYSEAIAELEGIVEAIEREEIEVDGLLEKVKRASFLLNYCREKLKHTEGEVKNVLADIADDRDDGKAA